MPGKTTYYSRNRWDPHEEEIRPKCSERAVEKTFELAAELGLIDDDSGALTNIGKEAADPGHYDSVLRRRARVRLQQLGCPVAHVNTVCLEMLQSEKVVLPTVNELYLAVCVQEGLDVSAAKFATLLRLLAATGGIEISRRHIFLPAGR